MNMNPAGPRGLRCPQSAARALATRHQRGLRRRAAARWCGRSGARAADRRRSPVERGGIEIGPQRVGEIELGVGELPQQEIADALLAAGADEEVRLRARKLIARYGARSRLGEAGSAVPDRSRSMRFDRLQDVPAPAVVRGDRQRRAACCPRSAPRLGDQAPELSARSATGRRRREPDAVLVQLRDFLLERADEQLHQERDFVGRPAPVLAAEREQRQVLDAALDAGATALRTASTPRRWPATRGR